MVFYNCETKKIRNGFKELVFPKTVSSVTPSPAPTTPRPFTPADIGLLSFLTFLIVCFVLCLVQSYRFYKATKKNARLTGQITKTPTTVPWTSELRDKTVQIGAGVRFECLNFQKQTHSNNEEKSQNAVDWVAKIINETYEGTSGWLQSVVPRTARIISVPMEYFKCGETCTEFKPNGYVAPEDAANSYYTYQMCGDNRIQVVRYVENDVTYVAGYCVYIPEPYECALPYNKMHIQNCYMGPKYFPKTDPVSTQVQIGAEVYVSGQPTLLEIPLENTQTTYLPETMPEADASETTPFQNIYEDLQESENESNPEFHTENLRNFKLHFCKTKKRIVAIGCVDGLVKHFDWNIFSKSYESSGCKTCKLEEWEESPPPYHMLNVWREEEA